MSNTDFMFFQTKVSEELARNERMLSWTAQDYAQALNGAVIMRREDVLFKLQDEINAHTSW